jgi:type I restriction enzyme R subunit
MIRQQSKHEDTKEYRESIAPAKSLLEAMGFQFLSREEAIRLRGGKWKNVILDEVLKNSLKAINHIQYKNERYLFSEENIQSAIQKLKNPHELGLIRNSELVYDLLTLGTSQEQSIDGDNKSFNIQYVDWKNPERNSFHFTEEFAVERNRSTHTIRPDLVLFVNGIPFGVIECKAVDVDLRDEGISQMLRNQSDEFAPHLFVYTQILMVTNQNLSYYATTGTSKEFWALWKEEGIEKEISQLLKYQADTKPTLQDRNIYSLFRPDRFLDLVYNFIIYDNAIKKIARYQQYFVVKSTLDRVKSLDSEGRRNGGIVWHTQGSGKSLTMVYLSRALALDPEILNPRIILVTDREDLDDQLKKTFQACKLDPVRAGSGRHLLELVSESKTGIITTLIHKFDKALNAGKFQDESKEIFILVDESHRTQFGSFSARMRQMFPNACYLGFTGTPLLKKEKNNFSKFGGLIQPYYSIRQAVEDQSVVPLLYEARHVKITQNKEAIDLWFERHTDGLSKEEKADLKKKYARAEMLNKADQVVYMRAFDISEHFSKSWKNTGFKAQLVAPNKNTALKYKEFLDDIGLVTSEVIISQPDMREGYEDVDDGPKDKVIQFWNKMITRFGKEENYLRTVIQSFKNSKDPEILIVVDKLLTGFDASRNTILYLCRTLREHTLLQAIARVNRLHEGKDYGYIVDYASILGELDTALNQYSALEGFDPEDLTGALQSIQSIVDQLPSIHSHIWDIFRPVRNKKSLEDCRVYLADDDIREEFYDLLTEYGKALWTALSSDRFLLNTDESKVRMYKEDYRFFEKVRSESKLTYAEEIRYKDYEPKIRKLLDTHIFANEVISLNEPVNIFDEKTFEELKKDRGIFSGKTDAAKADTIAHATKKAIQLKMEEDPVFYKKLSEMIQTVIDDYLAKRISEIEYLKNILELRNKFVNNEREDVPELLKGRDDAIAYYGVVFHFFEQHEIDSNLSKELSLSLAIAIEDSLKKNWKVHFWEDDDVVKRVINEIDDFLFDEIKPKYPTELSTKDMDEIIDRTMDVARRRVS